MASEIGKESHTPFIPKIKENINTKGTIAKAPLVIEITNPSKVFSMLLKNEDNTTFIPANIKPMKYILRPSFAKFLSIKFPSLLKIRINPSEKTNAIV